MRRERAARVLELDEAVTAAVAELKAKGFESPYLRAFVVARINPLRFKRGAKAEFDETIDKMLAGARRFDSREDPGGSGRADRWRAGRVDQSTVEARCMRQLEGGAGPCAAGHRGCVLAACGGGAGRGTRRAPPTRRRPRTARPTRGASRSPWTACRRPRPPGSIPSWASTSWPTSTGIPRSKDGNGYISRLTRDGKMDSLKFIAGGRGGVTLNAPKGMAIEGDTLWVADIDAARAFDKRTGKPIATVNLKGKAPSS